MTHEEIIKLAPYPEEHNKRIWAEGYLNALSSIPTKDYEALKLSEYINSMPRIRAWVARDGDASLRVHQSIPVRYDYGDGSPYDKFWRCGDECDLDLPTTLFPWLIWEDEPIEVELIIRKK